jgi:transposase-like protein
MKTLNPTVARVLKRLHYPLEVMLLCVRWYVAYSLSLRNLEEMMAERDIGVDHSTVHRWVIKLVPLFEKTFRNHKRPVGKSWRVDEQLVASFSGLSNFSASHAGARFRHGCAGQVRVQISLDV